MGDNVTLREMVREQSNMISNLVNKITIMETHHGYTKEFIEKHGTRIDSLERSDRNQKYTTGTIAAIAGALSGFAHKFFH
jgi:hypothetical protein